MDKQDPSAAGKPPTGLTKEERARELKRAAGEKELLAKVAEMPEPDRSMALQVHEIIKASAPELSPTTWYGMPAYARDGKVVCFFQGAFLKPGMPPSASPTGPTWVTASCGRWPLP